jgi:hypothetical protein
MDYKEKLRAWNSTDKYRSEVFFLKKILDPSASLDYGCGLGVCACIVGADGYDVNEYNEYLNYKFFYTELPNNNYGNIYFMHSFAHIPNPKDVLRILRSKYPEAKITVITPNKDYLDKINNPEYVPDPTVVKHYTQKELKEIFEDCGYKVYLSGTFGDELNGINERIFIQCTT